MSLSFIDPELDRKLNDIDEFIMEQGGNDVAVEYNNRTPTEFWPHKSEKHH